ncbi:MAG: hypothetical protein ACTHLJ_08380 [Angustibacter sp.]
MRAIVMTKRQAGRPEPVGARAWARRLLVELLIGFALAGLLVVVAWASSNAIPFVYGGY